MNFLHPLELSKSVLDPIHGLVRLTREEVKVINHIVYQRLRKVKQNGLLHLVFPSATHTRFEHSIGVLFVADSMLRALVFNSIASGPDGGKQNKVARLKDASPNQAVDLSGMDTEEQHILFRVTRLAALVHDLGHGPLSHTFDKFAPMRKHVLELMKDPRLESIREFRDVFESYDPKMERVPHEVMSCIFFAVIWSEIDDTNSPWVPKAVTAAILGEKALGKLDAPYRPWVSLANDLVSSAPADADRMDYLERDSRSCGVSYGLFDRNRLLKSMLCYQAEAGDDRLYRLGLKLSGYRAVENFIQARFELFVQIYYHKTNRAIESMLSEIARLAGQRIVVSAETLDELIDGYVLLSDEYFLDMLRGKAVEERRRVKDARINELAELVHRREPWKRVFDLQDHDVVEDGEDVMRRVERLCSELENSFNENVFYQDKIDPKATKDLDKGAAILAPVQGIYTARQSFEWEKRSPIIKALGHEEKMVMRIFAIDGHKGEIGEYRRRARELWENSR